MFVIISNTSAAEDSTGQERKAFSTPLAMTEARCSSFSWSSMSRTYALSCVSINMVSCAGVLKTHIM